MSFYITVSRFLLNLLTRSLLAGVVTYACWIPIEYYNYWFSWHVILCTLGMIPLMTEGFMLFAPDELWSKALNRKQKYWIHGTLLTLGTILVSVGSILTFYYLEDGYHLYTVHGITGLISMIFFLISLILGLGANYSNKLSKYARPVVFKLFHNCFGLLGYIIGVVSLCYSYYTNWFVFYTGWESRMVALIATIFGTVWAMNPAIKSGYNQIKTFFNL